MSQGRGPAENHRGNKRLSQPNLKAEDQAAARKTLDEGIKDVRDAVQYFLAQAEQLRQKQPASEARARMLYEAAWGSRIVAEQEVEAARHKIQQELWQKHRDEIAKKTPPGRQPAYVPAARSGRSSWCRCKPRREGDAQALPDAHRGVPDLTINADARFELAELLGERGEHDAAIKLLREALDKEPSPELTDKIRRASGRLPAAQGRHQGGTRSVRADCRQRQKCHECTGEVSCRRVSSAQRRRRRGCQAIGRLPRSGTVPELAGLTDRALLRLGYASGQLKQWDASRQAYEQVANRFGNGPWVPERAMALAGPIRTRTSTTTR